MLNVKCKSVSIPNNFWESIVESKITLTICYLLILNNSIFLLKAAPEADLWARWTKHQSNSVQKINHKQWATFLDGNLITNDKSNIYLVCRYPYCQYLHSFQKHVGKKGKISEGESAFKKPATKVSKGPGKTCHCCPRTHSRKSPDTDD